MGGVCFSDMGGGSFLSGGYPMGAINFGEGGGVRKKNKPPGGPPMPPPPAMGNPGLTVLLFLDFFLSSALIMIVLELPY